MNDPPNTSEQAALVRTRKTGNALALGFFPGLFASFIFRGPLQSAGIQPEYIAGAFLAAFTVGGVVYMVQLLRCPRCKRSLFTTKALCDLGKIRAEEASCPRCKMSVTLGM